MTSPYYPAYDGYYTMSNWDAEENALKRWFDNFKIDRNAWFASKYETLVVEEVAASARHIKKRQVCTIENIGYTEHQRPNAIRQVIMDHTAPPAPMLTFAAKRKWAPPPPKTPAELRREQEFAMMMARGMEPYVRRVPVFPAMSLMMLGPDFSIEASIAESMAVHYEERIEWRPRRRFDYMDSINYAMSSAPKLTPPAPTHRRNV